MGKVICRGRLRELSFSIPIRSTISGRKSLVADRESMRRPCLKRAGTSSIALLSPNLAPSFPT